MEGPYTFEGPHSKGVDILRLQLLSVSMFASRDRQAWTKRQNASTSYIRIWVMLAMDPSAAFPMNPFSTIINRTRRQKAHLHDVTYIGRAVAFSQNKLVWT